MRKHCYITTTLPYVNADPHIGFALELVQADIYARYKRLTEYEVFFNTGTDEHGIKIYRKALEEGKEPQAYVDEYAEKFRALKEVLGLSDDLHFIRTTDAHHKKAAQEFWQRCKQAGYIEKRQYRAKYCSGCELEKTDSELENGKCPLHPNLTLETLDEENYFFKFSAFQEKLFQLYTERPDLVVPDFRFNEIKAFAARGLRDFSISRVKAKMPWGVPVPDDPNQVMYVWFDALVNYISTLGWPDDEVNFKKWWVDTGGVIQFAGKDQVRQQAAMWQAMLMAAGLTPSQQIVVHGFVQSGGEKMSKSLGNVINPLALVREYGTDAVRYYLARHIHPFEDSDFTLAKFKEAYNADLANGLGNLVSRVMKMAEEHTTTPSRFARHPSLPRRQAGSTEEGMQPPREYTEAFEHYNIQAVAEYVMREVGQLDRYIQETEPFKLVKKDKNAGQKVIVELVLKLAHIAELLLPIMPATSAKIQEAIQENKKPENLFPRK